MGLTDFIGGPPMLGPRNSIVRILRGEDVSIDEMVRDHSEFIDARYAYFWELSELWVDDVHDYVGELA